MGSTRPSAEAFLRRANATCTVEFGGRAVNHDWDEWDEKEMRNFYKVTLATPRGSMDLVFWDSIQNTRASMRGFEAKPTSYDILSCLEKSDPGTFKEFCSECGFSDDSIRAYKTYVGVIEEYKNLQRIFTKEQLDQLAEIN